MKICSFGSLNMDYVYHVTEMVRPGETISSHSRQCICGGKGLNQSIALARAGAQVWHGGNVGQDGEGKALLAALEAAGVNTGCVRQLAEESSGHAIIQIDRHGQNCILLYGGANQRADAAQIEETLSHFAPGDWLVLQNEVNDLAALMRQAHARGLRIALNPSPMNEIILGLPLELADMFFLNELESAALAGCEAEADVLDALERRFPQAVLVLTKGAEGAVVSHRGQRTACPAQRVTPVDTTAAGDTFTGYFLSSWMRGDSVEASMRRATRAAALCVTRLGASVSIPTATEVDAMEGSHVLS